MVTTEEGEKGGVPVSEWPWQTDLSQVPDIKETSDSVLAILNRDLGFQVTGFKEITGPSPKLQFKVAATKAPKLLGLIPQPLNLGEIYDKEKVKSQVSNSEISDNGRYINLGAIDVGGYAAGRIERVMISKAGRYDEKSNEFIPEPNNIVVEVQLTPK